MIIQRIASAIKRQDLSQIIIEILIVVIGIFLGLQVQSWYDGRNSEEREKRAVAYLISDMEKTVEYLEKRDPLIERRINSNLSLIDILEKGELPAEDFENFEAAIFQLGRGVEPADVFINSFYDENLDRIGSDDLRNVIEDYRGGLRRYNEGIKTTMESIDAARNTTLSKTPVQRMPSRNTVNIIPLINYDFDQLKNDSDYRAAILSINGLMFIVRNQYRSLANRSRLMLEALTNYQAGGAVKEVDS